MGRKSLRAKLLESGVTTLHKRGYAASGVREITAEAGVPQGCFTNHFRSKEAFAAAALDLYHERTIAIMNATLSDETRSPIQRLMAYFDAITDLLAAFEWRFGCMISNLSLETAEHSEVLRKRLDSIFESLTGRFAETIRAAQGAGEARRDVDAEEMADILMAAWHGAMLRMKVERRRDALDRFKRVFVGTLLPP